VKKQEKIGVNLEQNNRCARVEKEISSLGINSREQEEREEIPQGMREGVVSEFDFP